jgi:hypothetical protein
MIFVLRPRGEPQSWSADIQETQGFAPIRIVPQPQAS